MEMCKKSYIAVLLAVLMLFAFFPVLPSGSAYAAGELKLSETSIVYDPDDEWTSGYVCTENGSVNIISVTIEDPEVAILEYTPGDNSFYVKPNTDGKHGKTVVHVAGEGGAKASVDVEVTEAYMIDRLSETVFLTYNWYGSRQLEILAYVPCSGTVRVGSDLYDFTSAGDYQYPVTIYLDKLYDLGTRVEMTFTTENGYTITKEDKMGSVTYVTAIDRSKKKIKVTVYNPHKGDKVFLKFKGRTYKKTIGSDQDENYYPVTFKVRRTVRAGAGMQIWIKNVKGRTLHSRQSYTLQGGHWDEDMDSIE